MFSLFSSFDYYWEVLPNFEFFLVFLFFSFTYYYSSFSFYISKVKSFLLNFLSSLSPLGFSKGSLVFFLSVMALIFLMNLYAIFPFVFPHSAQPSMIFLLGLAFWSSFLIFLNRFGYSGFLSHCIPEGSPMPLVPVLFLIELVSNVIRPITLTVRLVANIVAGHLLLILLSKVVYIFSWAFAAYFLLNVVELFVAAVQAYIFLTMVTLYYCDVN